jgi:thymidylate synthase ThyX
MSFAPPPTPPSIPPGYHVESFTPEERELLSRFFTNVDGPVYGIVNLPEVVKGALFARYSRSPLSVRRLFLDEFVAEPDLGVRAIAETAGDGGSVVGLTRAQGLYEKVFTQFGDDSIAQLGGAHIACEQASNVLTKVLEWGRLASYLEQSTRYIFYDRRLGDRYRYHVPRELVGSPLESDFRSTMDGVFDTYSAQIGNTVPYYESRFPKKESDSAFVWRATIRAKACDDLRGMLPAATTSNVGIFGSGQAHEMLLLRMRAHPLLEIRDYADMMLTELRKMIPSFLTRVDLPDRGGAWTDYLTAVAADLEAKAAHLPSSNADRTDVSLVDWDPDGETKVAAAALYAVSDLPDDQLLAYARSLSSDERADLIRSAVGDRGNRRHKPGRAMERTSYRFDVLSDYGAFRDLQRHRMLTIEWQRLSTQHGYVTPEAIADIGATSAWDEVMDRTAALADRIESAHGPVAAQYAVPFAYRIRYYIDMNAREAFHLLELRSQASGHPRYRSIAQEMHRLIRDQAGHRVIADAMQFVDHNDYDLARLEEERRLAAKRAARGSVEG